MLGRYRPKWLCASILCRHAIRLRGDSAPYNGRKFSKKVPQVLLCPAYRHRLGVAALFGHCQHPVADLQTGHLPSECPAAQESRRRAILAEGDGIRDDVAHH
jgi:hypothetical protein